jgi:vanillate O-demethylase monooxygenase subunit
MNDITSRTGAWPKNAWYVAGMAEEIEGKPLGRQVCGIRLVFFRDRDGKVAALDDFCPHRGAPLSLGSMRDGRLVCGYHGLEMGCNGRAVSMPNQIVSGLRPIGAYPAVERYGFIWVWPGDSAQADASKLPHFHWGESDEWRFTGGTFHINCDYRLMIDNLMDLTHENYLHASSIGQREIDQVPVNTKVEGDEVVTSRFMDGVKAVPFWEAMLQIAGLPSDGLVDRWQVCHFSLPSHVMIDVGVGIAGTGGYAAVDRTNKLSSVVVGFLTPETETSNWYFWGLARDFAVKNESLSSSLVKELGNIFSEDLKMVESQQRNLLLYPDRKLSKFNVDAGGARSRIIIKRAIAGENGAIAEESSTEEILS